MVCDAAVKDPSSGKKSLIGIFSRINAGKLPTKRWMTVYIKLADAEGFYKMEIRFVETKSGEILGNAQGDVHIRERLLASDFFLDFPPLPIPREGRHEFQVWANNVYLGGAFIDVVERART